nr:immunoglobulin light chain junction region [Macaca mulatta]MOW60287.1 immunoglobulin light chain junction region [Macaca mulatta]
EYYCATWDKSLNGPLL